jgi:hypothetical protein
MVDDDVTWRWLQPGPGWVGAFVPSGRAQIFRANSPGTVAPLAVGAAAYSNKISDFRNLRGCGCWC